MIRNNIVYPKAKRISKTDFVWQITEKLTAENASNFDGLKDQEEIPF